MEGRLTMSNMAIEAGGKAGLVPVDDTTLAYVRSRVKRPWQVFDADADAVYADVFEFDISTIEPTVACPNSPDNIKPVSALSPHCSRPGGHWLLHQRTHRGPAAGGMVLKGRKIHPIVRCVVLPGSVDVEMQALREGLLEIFMEAGVSVSTPTCGPCLGGHMGVLAPNEVCVSTTNRNFVGRMGHATAKVYLVNPGVAAATAVMGRIASPEELS